MLRLRNMRNETSIGGVGGDNVVVLDEELLSVLHEVRQRGTATWQPSLLAGPFELPEDPRNEVVTGLHNGAPCELVAIPEGFLEVAQDRRVEEFAQVLADYKNMII